MVESGLTQAEIKWIKDVIASHPEVEKAILYGSRAKGNYKPASDIDIALVGEKLNLTIQQQIETDLDDLMLPFKIDVSIYHHISNPDLLEHIRRVGKVLYTGTGIR